MNEASKARARLSREGLFSKYFQGTILDVGCGGDKIHPSAFGYDKEQGDATTLEGIPNDSIDCLFSSHCLEHLRQPQKAIMRWWEVVKPNGYLFVIVPSADLYEQGVWPSTFNTDHKHTFDLHSCPTVKWRKESYNLLGLIRDLPNHYLLSARVIDTNYNYACPFRVDQSMGDVEVALEVIVQKLPPLPDA
jgi:predicted SAM-dependent methyltransferase